MIYGYLRSWDMQEFAAFANAGGAMNTIKLGARSGMCTEAEVRKFMAKTERRASGINS
jgi:sugar/nucleoside kinase (ribokinase family)